MGFFSRTQANQSQPEKKREYDWLPRELLYVDPSSFQTWIAVESIFKHLISHCRLWFEIWLLMTFYKYMHARETAAGDSTVEMGGKIRL